MNCTERFFMEILRAFATGKREKIDIENVDKHKLYSLAKRHSVAGILSYMLSCYGIFEGEEFREKLSRDYEKTLSLMLRREIAADQLCHKLCDNSVEHIIFKGPTVARAYPVPELRTYSDVDIIIRKADRDKVRAMMEGMNYSFSVTDGGVVNCYHKGIEFYELHTALNVPSQEEAVFSSFWEHTVADKNSTLRFEESFNLCYLISHIEKHMHAGGAGVKMYLDIALLIMNSQEDELLQVRDTLSLCGLDKFFETVLYLCHRWFASPLPRWVEAMDEELYDRMCEFTLSGGVYGDHSKKSSIDNALARELSSGKRGAKFRFIMNRAFPQKTELWRVHPKYEGKTFLVPWVWFIHTLSFLRKDKHDRVRAVTSADLKTAESKREFLSSIGCRE